MTDIVNLYPKSSCPCENCLGSYPNPKGPQTNLAIRVPPQWPSDNQNVGNPVVSPFYDCYYESRLNTEVQPQNREGIVQLNPQVYTEKMATNFVARNVKPPLSVNPGGKRNPHYYTQQEQSCPGGVAYFSMDPRQFSATRGEILALDSIPMDSKMKLADIYNKKYDRYGVGFTPYEEINDGQITYYIDRSIESAFYKPVFSEPAQENSSLLQDPMGALLPQYNRVPLINTENPTVTIPQSYPYCLSFLQDTQSFREDIMALQQRHNNQSKWSARWNWRNG